jgi:hypothetical protein
VLYLKHFDVPLDSLELLLKHCCGLSTARRYA